jgi:hypothetical protein
MEGRLAGVIESFVVIGILLVFYWTSGFVIKRIFDLEIRTKTGYMICIIGGFILKRTLIIYLTHR